MIVYTTEVANAVNMYQENFGVRIRVPQLKYFKTEAGVAAAVNKAIKTKTPIDVIGGEYRKPAVKKTRRPKADSATEAESSKKARTAVRKSKANSTSVKTEISKEMCPAEKQKAKVDVKSTAGAVKAKASQSAHSTAKRKPAADTKATVSAVKTRVKKERK